jgi:hypothetical protein
MKIFRDLRERRCGSSLRAGGGTALAVAILAVWLLWMPRVSAQVTPSADRGGLHLAAGGTASGYYVQYGQRDMVGVAGFVDIDSRRRLGAEAEGRWAEFRQTADVHVETYSAGVRYHFEFGRFQPYTKALAGEGEFNFPYNYARGNYLVVTGGGGVDYRLNQRIQIRAADFEYQDWPQFTFGAMTAFSVSAGIRVRILGRYERP